MREIARQLTAKLQRGAERLGDAFGRHKSRLLGVLVGCLLLLPLSAFWNHQTVDVMVFETPLMHSEHVSVNRALGALKPGSFWNMDVYEIADKINTLRWVQAAQVSKAWPNKLMINVAPEKPIAKWNQKGYFNEDGDIITSFRAPIELPEITASPAQGGHAVSLMREVERQLMPVAKLSLDVRGAIAVTLKNGIEINFGAEAFAERLAKIRALLHNNHRRGRQVERIDARYPTGLAVAWRQELTHFSEARSLRKTGERSWDKCKQTNCR